MATVADTLTALRTNYDGQPWHGSAFRTLLEGIDDTRAHARPIAGAHTIAELLAHAVAWTMIVDRRLRGEVFAITPDIDFPEAANVRWPDLVERADRAHARLLEVVERLRDEDLAQPVAGKPYSVEFMLSGLMHHNTYHAAQIAMLKKA
jgi:uncharacterized damage-inducible protein DinB